MPTKRNYKTSGQRSNTRNSTKSFGGTRAGSTSTLKTWQPSSTYAPTKFSTHRKQVVAKIASFRTINQQIGGAGKVTAFSPSNANKWINLVNSGNAVYKFNGMQANRYFGKLFSHPINAVSPSIALKTLQKQFGTGIKAVTRGKGNNWLIAASTNVSASPFRNYNFG